MRGMVNPMLVARQRRDGGAARNLVAPCSPSTMLRMVPLPVPGRIWVLTGTGETIGKARKLRKTMSLPEVLLWRELRQRPGGFKFRKQHPAGRYVLDFACLEARLAVEIDGEAHNRGDAPAHDAYRDEWLASQGFATLRIAATDVLKNLEGVVQMVLLRCASGKPLHHPAAPGGPPPRAGEDLQ